MKSGDNGKKEKKKNFNAANAPALLYHRVGYTGALVPHLAFFFLRISTYLYYGVPGKIVSLNVQSVMNPARFDSLYNHIQSAEIDIALALQEAFLDESCMRPRTALAQELETRYPLVSIASNKAEGRGGLVTIINKRNTEWSPINDTGVDEVSHIIRADQDGSKEDP
jgi:hypothetical protein